MKFLKNSIILLFIIGLLGSSTQLKPMLRKGGQMVGKGMGAKVTQVGQKATQKTGKLIKDIGKEAAEEEVEERVKGKRQTKAGSLGGAAREVITQTAGKKLRQHVGSAQRGAGRIPVFEGAPAAKQAISRFTMPRRAVRLPSQLGRAAQQSGQRIIEMPLPEGSYVRQSIGRMPRVAPTTTPSSTGGMLRGRIFKSPATVRVPKPGFTKTPQQQIMETLGYRAPKARTPTAKAQLKDLKMRKDIARQRKEAQRERVMHLERELKDVNKDLKELEAELQAKQRTTEIKEAEELIESLARQQKHAAELRTQRAAEEARLEQLRKDWKEKIAKYNKQQELQTARARRSREQKAREKQFMERRAQEKVPQGTTKRLQKQLRERELKQRVTQQREIAGRKASLRRGFQESRVRAKERQRLERERHAAQERARIERDIRLAHEYRPAMRQTFARPTRLAPIIAVPEYGERPEPGIKRPHLEPEIGLPPIVIPEQMESEERIKPFEERVRMIPFEEPVIPIERTHGYQEIYRIATTPTEQLLAEITENPMQLEWAEGSVGIEQMINAFNDQFKLLKDTLVGLETGTNIYSRATNQLKLADFEQMKQIIARKMAKELEYLGIPLTR